MASYAVVETALARMHDASPEAQKGSFRGRIKHLQRLGLPMGEKPGKGKRIDYTLEQIWQLSLALELAEFGVDPTNIVTFICNNWNSHLYQYLQYLHLSKDFTVDMMCISPSFMSESWKPAPAGPYNIQFVEKEKLNWNNTSTYKRRLLAINMRDMLENLTNQLKYLEG